MIKFTLPYSFLVHVVINHGIRVWGPKRNCGSLTGFLNKSSYLVGGSYLSFIYLLLLLSFILVMKLFSKNVR